MHDMMVMDNSDALK